MGSGPDGDAYELFPTPSINDHSPTVSSHVLLIPSTVPLCHTTQSSKPPPWMQDYVCCSQSPSSSSLVTGQYSLSSFLTYRHLPFHTQYFFASISHIPKPRTYAEAIKDHRWVEAMQQEIQALESNVTWDVYLPFGKTPIGYKWIFKVKYDYDSLVEWFKSRLLGQGFTWQEGIAYHETFPLIVKEVTIHIIIALTAQHGCSLFQMDVYNSFLQGDLHEKVYMRLPLGFRLKGKLGLENCKIHSKI
ncbi:protein detoxification 35 [Gossypium australe]|uniref:Protein detoxification 35 n=1 Tax=Gossypium australe TaxID=47621 RepID=A0A5B6WYS8_9ROSI|nr:protein detoxification 35 [Gossypium australe]